MKTPGRRRFMAGAAAGAASLLMGPWSRRIAGGQTPPSDRTGLPFALGMASYTFREFGLDEAIAMTRRLELTRIALKDVHLPLDTPDEEIARAAARIRTAGVEPYGCGVVYMRTEAEVRNAFRYAAAAGMTVIIGVPDHERLPLVDDLVKKTGLVVAIHNHGPGDKLYPTPQSVMDRIGGLDRRVGLCLDVGHTARSGIDPAAEVLRFADRLHDVHVKDVTAATAEGTAIEVGRGVVDISALFAALKKVRYAGTVSFEYEKDGRDPMPGLFYSLGYVHGVLFAERSPARD